MYYEPDNLASIPYASPVDEPSLVYCCDCGCHYVCANRQPPCHHSEQAVKPYAERPNP